MLKLKNVSVSFGKNEAEVQALKNVSLEIDRGDFLTITGRSGCGKTTLLNIMGGILKPDSGEYYYENENVYDKNDRELAKFRNLKLGFIVQNFALINEKSVIDNIYLPMKFRKKKKDITLLEEYDIFEKLELTDKRKSYPSQLSGGQKQRVAIARALIGNPEIILADEPTGSLDEKNTEIIAKLLMDINKSGKTIIMVTHDAKLSECGNKKILMRDGRIQTYA